MYEQLKLEERAFLYEVLWRNEELHRFQWALVSYFPSKSNGETGWQSHIESLLGEQGIEWELSSFHGNMRLVTDYLPGTDPDLWLKPRVQKHIVIYCNHTLDSIQVLEKLINDKNFTASLVIGLMSPKYLEGADWKDHIITSPIVDHFS